MSVTNLIELDQPTALTFQKIEGDDQPKASLKISSKDSAQNVAFKIKTTAPKLFVVKPIQGVIAPGQNVMIEIRLQTKEL